MRVAIVHDYIKEYGGAERVLEALHEVYPNAPVFTTIYLPKFLGPHKNRFKSWKIKTSWFQYVPFKSKLISPMRILAPFLFKSFDFSKFDIVIVSQTGAYTPNLINKNGAVQICYSHTPPRYLYGYATAREWKRNSFSRVAGEIANHILRMVDFKSSQNVDYFIANSENVRSRIKKFYRKDAKVIYPPVDITRGPATRFLPASAPSATPRSNSVRAVGNPSTPVTPHSYFLAGGRIAKPKHVDLIVKAFEELNLPLKVFGRSFANEKLKSSKNNIEFLGEVSDEEKYQLMANAKAFVFASEDEDFGITPVEAMAVGTPVIAYRSGGVLESVVDGKTGIFFDELTVGSLKNAIERFNNLHFDTEFIKHHAKKFSKDRFKREIRDFINLKFK